MTGPDTDGPGAGDAVGADAVDAGSVPSRCGVVVAGATTRCSREEEADMGLELWLERLAAREAKLVLLGAAGWAWGWVGGGRASRVERTRAQAASIASPERWARMSCRARRS